MIYPLKNPIKNFAWGSRQALSEHFNIANPNHQPQAELWMGAHPTASSVISISGEEVALSSAIETDPQFWLGQRTLSSGHTLPFLMKLLAAETPLSIQVHPSKAAAELGFNKENQLGIAIDAPHRNYKDANHKPELVYALTPYLAMNGFRVFEQIVEYFDLVNLESIRSLFAPFKRSPSSATLAHFFSGLLAMQAEERARAIAELIESIKSLSVSQNIDKTWALVTRFHSLYPSDIGIFSPLFLNVIELQPGEAMFLYAETPHAYIHGLGVEVMANSDNVLRAGLTPKHIDVNELVSNTRFEPISYEHLRMKPTSKKGRAVYPIPVDDFKFDLLHPSDGLVLAVSSAEVLLVLTDSVTIRVEDESLVIQKGESVALPAAVGEYQLEGKGAVARAYC
ncbi:mannose-6-phosphate isomerase, class I [Vibrio sp. JPW-9-11-11]|uniref:mannose-6-phosphate isomerase, class I n=1 Tax=Vibrio sp. JPW-9-11-11 TaxID=1416532 RepID=UPI0015930B7A|nr:mannose-6-phosphate isomerase, class I [Vibrio sp. JPW-9-11-11]NVD05395.1 mannose-6-phosphate isomerase, class I [Vibrio sp. JPW-9-11-11]